MKMQDLNLTELETATLEALINGLYAEPGFSDVDASDLSHMTNIPTRQLRGVISSLVQKGIVFVENSGTGYDLVYLKKAFWALHPEWSSAI
jgi:sugar-specific transcriptional regulator TrmB